ELSVCFSLSITNLSHSKFYLISLSHSSFQFLRQTRTYFGNLLGENKKIKFKKSVDKAGS
ncbi:hypothetical protein ACTGW7_09950, partial [Streptococcus suis]